MDTIEPPADDSNQPEWEGPSEWDDDDLDNTVRNIDFDSNNSSHGQSVGALPTESASPPTNTTSPQTPHPSATNQPNE